MMSINMRRESTYSRAKPYLAVIFLQFGYAGLGIIAKFALNAGMSHYTFAVYRNAVATVVLTPFAAVLERKVRPKMTVSIFLKIMLLAFLEPVIDQNLCYAGMNYTTATFATAMTNVIPGMTFIMAWILRLEKVDIIRSLHSQAKVVGTLVTAGGAMVMTLVKGATVGLPWTKHMTTSYDRVASSSVNQQDPIKGSIMLVAGCFCWAAFYILQAITLKSYPAALSLSSLICVMGSLQGIVLTFIVEKGNKEIWSLGWDWKLLSALYGGIVCSGVGYYVSGVLMREKGPVFVTAFNPLSMVIVAILGSFVLAEKIYIGGVLGAAIIVLGLYIVIWGKRKDEDSSTKSGSDPEAPTDQQANTNGDGADS